MWAFLVIGARMPGWETTRPPRVGPRGPAGAPSSPPPPPLPPSPHAILHFGPAGCPLREVCRAPNCKIAREGGWPLPGGGTAVSSIGTGPAAGTPWVSNADRDTHGVPPGHGSVVMCRQDGRHTLDSRRDRPAADEPRGSFAGHRREFRGVCPVRCRVVVAGATAVAESGPDQGCCTWLTAEAPGRAPTTGPPAVRQVRESSRPGRRYIPLSRGQQAPRPPARRPSDGHPRRRSPSRGTPAASSPTSGRPPSWLPLCCVRPC